jgi:hypothetical protein
VVSAADSSPQLIPVLWTGAATSLSSSSSFMLMRLSGTQFQAQFYSENLVAPEIEPRTSGSAARNSDH